MADNIDVPTVDNELMRVGIWSVSGDAPLIFLHGLGSEPDGEWSPDHDDFFGDVWVDVHRLTANQAGLLGRVLISAAMRLREHEAAL